MSVYSQGCCRKGILTTQNNTEIINNAQKPFGEGLACGQHPVTLSPLVPHHCGFN